MAISSACPGGRGFNIKGKSGAVGGETVEASHPVVEVHTDGDFPARALSPILFVGDVPLRECHRVREGVYRFIAPAGVELKKNARIALEWSPNPAQVTPTGFKLLPDGE